MDEAQDTSPLQWRVIQGLSEAFFDSADASKTLFVVGDPKQSIYSFQGADPASFHQMRDFLAQKLTIMARPFHEISLDMSFRSTPPILKMIDQVFSNPQAKPGVVASTLRHDPHEGKQHLPGRIEVWPLVIAEPPHALNPWEISRTTHDTQDPQACVAATLAERLQRLFHAQTPALGHDRPLRPSDVMILVRQRGRLVDLLVRHLKKAGVPVAGADRMVLQDSLAIQDLLALASFALLPADDLNLAIILKGPFLGLSEEALFRIAYGRGEVSLWGRLKAEGPSRPLSFLENLLAQRHLSPFAFFSYLLTTLQGRALWIARLGAETQEALDEFMHLCLLFEGSHIPTLQGFLDWFHEKPLQIQRDPEHTRDEVRILTVHGSKGLEAPLIILPDTVSPPRTPPLFVDHQGTLLWNPPQQDAPQMMRSLQAAHARLREEEYNRLLYVALTRAQSWLWIWGWTGTDTPPETSWYHKISTSLKTHPDAEPLHIPGFSGQGWGINPLP